jgi:hypothetical protein
MRPALVRASDLQPVESGQIRRGPSAPHLGGDGAAALGGSGELMARRSDIIDSAEALEAAQAEEARQQRVDEAWETLAAAGGQVVVAYRGLVAVRLSRGTVRLGREDIGPLKAAIALLEAGR